ncbi:acetate--CoA ligase family protein [Variovorax sp. J22P271]|uniref:acetate--CoA ligase family protein n=1 Tax=Variovorax davisae TaxID=3053515 RepID=UPI002577CFEF|nr:acetate--CoA ligase family protein [Variovorax sp. J22P271]MDM0032015.1 acetate--CoA ligase family protein [Variovorax sp. J22P271]
MVASNDAISRLLKPRSVAVIGASADLTKTSGRPVAYLQKHGFAGAIYPVNPKADTIAGLHCYPDVGSLPQAPDVALVLLGAERAHTVVSDLSARGTAAAIVLASGYAEAGDQGRQRQHELLEAAGGMRLLGPNTIGLVNLSDRITLSASGALESDELLPGGIAVVSQSGGILGSLLSRGAARGIGFSKLISTSNEADLDLADFVNHLADDEATRVIALYMESIRDVAKFRAAAAKAARAGKPLVVFKIGRSESGAQAAASHTGALAGADRMYDALFREVGAIRARDFADLLDLPAALATERRLEGKRVAILTSTGGAGTLVADSLGVAGFEAPAPDAATADKLRALQAGGPSVLDRNPIDVTLAGLQPQLLRRGLAALLESMSYDAVVVIVGSSALAMPDLVADAIRDCLPSTSKPVLAYVSPHAPAVASLLNRHGVPAFSAPESCTVALQGLFAHSHPPLVTRVDAGPVVRIDDLPSGSLNEAEAKSLFARFGVQGVREHAVADAQQAAEMAGTLGDKVVLKILSRTITHKTEVGGVAVAVPSAQVAARVQQMERDVRTATGDAPEGYLVQEMVSGGTELILGLHRDALGAALLVGMGGVTAELINDSVLRMVPPGGALTRDEATAMVRELKTWPLLDSYRGRPAADVDALVDAIVAFSRMASQMGAGLETAEINPLFVLPKGMGVRAADGVAVLRAKT